MSIGPLLFAIIQLADTVLQIYVWLLIASAIMSWLVAFNVINTRNQFVRTVGDFLYRITEPILRPLRRVLPMIGGIDISSVALILIIFFVQTVLRGYESAILRM